MGRGQQVEDRYLFREKYEHPLLDAIFFKSRSSLSMSSLEGIYTGWHRIIELYSDLALTKLGTDRLVALSRIAQEFKYSLQNTTVKKNSPEEPGSSPSNRNNEPSMGEDWQNYICGLWRGNIIHDLQWEQHGQRGPRFRLEGSPTWSWASLMTSISTDEETIHSPPEPEIKNIHVGLRVKWSSRNQKMTESHTNLRNKDPIIYLRVDEPKARANHKVNNPSEDDDSEEPLTYDVRFDAPPLKSPLRDEHTTFSNTFRFAVLAISAKSLGAYNIGAYFTSLKDWNLAEQLTA
ncbi:hypothetical protein BX600DRAFT_439368 [Xylariales sp. PMI_506]|nr:hypothetical protein BX600DRAFT_439368 [Xylariales sp. PMI_506]